MQTVFLYKQHSIGIKVKRLFLVFLLSSLMTSSVMAQQVKPRNPVKGYIITNSNDTILGTIDYRRGYENSKSCRFMSDSDSLFQELTPNDIQGYRMLSNGVYYVACTLPIEGNETHLFAEYLLKGGISLFRYEGKEQTYFIMRDEEGKTATAKEEWYDKNRPEETEYLKGKNISEVAGMLSMSVEAIRSLWQNDVTATNLVKITRRYNEQYCKDAGDCISFQYDSNKSSLYKTKFLIGMGCHYGSASNESSSATVGIPHLSIGGEFTSLRSNPALSYQFVALVGVWNSDMILTQKNKELWVELDCGVLYRFNKHQVERSPVPFVCGGISLSILSGGYVGVGYEFPIGKSYLRLAATGRYNGFAPFKDVLFDDLNENMKMGNVVSGSLLLSLVL